MTRQTDILEIFAEAGAHDRILGSQGGIWRQWSTPDMNKAAAIIKNASNVLAGYHSNPAVRAANLESKRRQRLDPEKRALERERDRERKRRKAVREKLPNDREGLTHHFTIYTKNEAGDGVREVDGYIQTGEYVDGKLGEIFMKVGKAGDEGALFDDFAKMFSLAIQFGAPLEVACKMLINTRYAPCGATKNKDIPRCTSPTDYIARYLLRKYGLKEVAPMEEVLLPVGS